jgi:transcriptional regulator with XRE-family HTH domain
MKTLRQWRIARFLGVKPLATKAGVSNKTIVQIEHGRQRPTLRTIQALSDALEVDPREVKEFAEALEAMESLEGEMAA